MTIQEKKEGSPIPPSFWMPVDTPGNDWDCSGARERAGQQDFIRATLLEQLALDCHINMIQAEWYLMIYGVRPPVPEKA